MKFSNPYFTETEKIELLERWLIVHSIIYYRLGSSIVSDKAFDANAYQLVDLIKSFPKAFKKSRYHDAFVDFDGSTGFDLYNKLNDKEQKNLYNTAKRISRGVMLYYK